MNGTPEQLKARISQTEMAFARSLRALNKGQLGLAQQTWDLAMTLSALATEQEKRKPQE